MKFAKKQDPDRPKRITAGDIEKLPQKQGFRCTYTGIEITPVRSSLDHRNPRSLGGADDLDNLQVVLPVINRAKGTMSHDQFVAMCHAVAKHVQQSFDTTWIDGLIDD